MAKYHAIKNPNQVRKWVEEGKTYKWIAQQLTVSIGLIQLFCNENKIRPICRIGFKKIRFNAGKGTAFLSWDIPKCIVRRMYGPIIRRRCLKEDLCWFAENFYNDNFTSDFKHFMYKRMMGILECGL